MRNFWRGELPIPNSTEYAIEPLYTGEIRLSSIFIVSAAKYDCFKATDSSVCRIALLGFAIRVDALVNMKEGDNQRDQDKGLDSPSPCPLGFLPLAPSFLTHTHTPSGCWLNSNNHLNIVYPVNAGTLNATRPQVSTYISG